jgi:hypothetical protein
LNRSATSIPSACRIANIALNDAMILSYDANLGRMEFSERTGPPARAIIMPKGYARQLPRLAIIQTTFAQKVIELVFL